jgi:hypothetical protein
MSLLSKKEASEATVAGQKLECLSCGHSKFLARKFQLITKTETLLGGGALADEATCYLCERCRHVHWYLESDPNLWEAPS